MSSFVLIALLSAAGSGLIGISIGIDLLGTDPCDLDLLNPGDPQCGEGCSGVTNVCQEHDFITQSTWSHFGTDPLLKFKICGIVIIVLSVILCVIQIVNACKYENFLGVVLVGHIIVVLAILACHIAALVFLGNGVEVKVSPSTSCTCTCKYKGNATQITLFVFNMLTAIYRFINHFWEKTFES